EPDAVNASRLGQGQQVAILVGVVLRRLGAEADLGAERILARPGSCQGGEDLLGGLAVVEEIVVGAEEVLDAEALEDAAHLVDDRFRTPKTPRLLIESWNRAIGTVELAALRDDDAANGGVTAHLRVRQRSG